MKETVRQYLNRYLVFTNEEVDVFFQHLKSVTFKKRAFLLKEGSVCHHQFFILHGLVRFFYIDDKGNEQTTQFGIENWWVTNTESFILQTPSTLNIQALEDTSVLTLTKTALDELYLQVPKLERLFRIITEKTLIALQRRDSFYMKKNSEEKYQQIVHLLPDFLQRVPQYMLASYLGMTPEHLSAIRKNNH